VENDLTRVDLQGLTEDELTTFAVEQANAIVDLVKGTRAEEAVVPHIRHLAQAQWQLGFLAGVDGGLQTLLVGP
jgi:hypothetical protein